MTKAAAKSMAAAFVSENQKSENAMRENERVG